LLKGVPVITIDAAAFESSKPAKSVAAEGIKTKAIVWLAVQAEAMRERDPLLGSELVFDVNGVQRKFGQVRLTEAVNVDIDHSDGETKQEHVSTGNKVCV
jgi:hypothetical protein